MAANVLRTSPVTVRAPFAPTPTLSPKPFYVSFRAQPSQRQRQRHNTLRFSHLPSLRFLNFVPLASQGETDTTDTVVDETQQDSEVFWFLSTVNSFFLQQIGMIFNSICIRFLNKLVYVFLTIVGVVKHIKKGRYFC